MKRLTLLESTLINSGYILSPNCSGILRIMLTPIFKKSTNSDRKSHSVGQASGFHLDKLCA